MLTLVRLELCIETLAGAEPPEEPGGLRDCLVLDAERGRRRFVLRHHLGGDRGGRHLGESGRIVRLIGRGLGPRRGGRLVDGLGHRCDDGGWGGIGLRCGLARRHRGLGREFVCLGLGRGHELDGLGLRHRRNVDDRRRLGGVQVRDDRTVSTSAAMSSTVSDRSGLIGGVDHRCRRRGIRQGREARGRIDLSVMPDGRDLGDADQLDRVGGSIRAVRPVRRAEEGRRHGHVRERRRQDLVAEMRRARQAARLDLIPAVRAGVLPTGHAEVERLVERVELMRGQLAIGLAASGGHRLVHRRLVGHDEVLQAAGQDLHALEPRARALGLERVARATPFAEGFGQDLCHRVPGSRADDARVGRAVQAGREYSAGSPAPFHRAYLDRTPNVMGGPTDIRGFSGPSGRLRDRPCRLSPPSSGSSNACLSARPHGSSEHVCNRSRSSIASSGRWKGERLTTTDRTLVPNRFVVHLHPADLAEFGDMTETLASELADGALAFARAHHYTVVDRPRVDLLADPAIERADIRVDARFAEAIGGRGASGPAAAAPDGSDPASSADATNTRVYEIPRPTTPRAVLHVTDPDGRTRRVVIEGGSLTIGRATDNDLRRPRQPRVRVITDGSPDGAARSSTRTSAAPTDRASTGCP